MKYSQLWVVYAALACGLGCQGEVTSDNRSPRSVAPGQRPPTDSACSDPICGGGARFADAGVTNAEGASPVPLHPDAAADVASDAAAQEPNAPENKPEEVITPPPDANPGEPTTSAAPPPFPMLGVYAGNEPDAVVQFESWLGRSSDGVLGYTGFADWTDFDGSIPWAAGVWGTVNRPVFWSVPLIPKNATLQAAANGDYDAHYVAAARALVGFRPQDPVLHIRTGWECNGDWFPWTAQTDPQAYAAAFRRFVAAFRSVSATRFDFEWNVSDGIAAMNPEDAYPGDDYVDIIGMDFYWNTQWESTDAATAWQHKVDEPWGLAWHQQFAAAHHKRTSYSEWGVGTDAAGPYLEAAKTWFIDHDVVFHTYWNSNADFAGMLSNGQYPQAASIYRTLFGAQ